MKPPQKGETFHDVYKRASLAVKKELDSLKKECKDYLKEILHQKLIDELDTDKKHHHLMRLCANAFADTELSSQSGYKFYFAEPLIERVSEINKNSGGIFDIFLWLFSQFGIYGFNKKSLSVRQLIHIKIQTPQSARRV
jgi:hypothetical protein